MKCKNCNLYVYMIYLLYCIRVLSRFVKLCIPSSTESMGGDFIEHHNSPDQKRIFDEVNVIS